MSNISIYNLIDRLENKPETELDDDTVISIHANSKEFRIRIQYDGKFPASILITENTGNTITLNPVSANGVQIL